MCWIKWRSRDRVEELKSLIETIEKFSQLKFRLRVALSAVHFRLLV